MAGLPAPIGAVVRRAAAGVAATRARANTLRLLRYTDTRTRVLTVGYVVLRAVVPLAFVCTAGVFVDRVVRAPEGRLTLGGIVGVLVVLGALFAAQELVGAVQPPLRELIAGRVNTAVQQRAMRAATRGTGVAHIAEPEVRRSLEELGSLTERSNTPGAATAGVVLVVAEYLTALLALALLASRFPLLSLLLLVAGLLIRFVFRSRCMGLAAAGYNGGEHRVLAGYYTTLGHEPAYAKEIRLFGLGAWVADRYQASALAGESALRRARRRAVGPVAAAYGVGYVAAAVALVVLAVSTTRGTLGIGWLTVLVPTCFLGLGMARFFDMWDFDIEFGCALMPVLEALERRAAEAEPVAVVPLPRPAAPERSVQLSGIRFQYPGSSTPVLRCVDLTVPIGRSLAIVGVNGAGKTTLTKILCGLYQPDAGEILIDGVPQPTAGAVLQQSTAVIFQHFRRYPATAAENIGYGAVEHLADRAGIRAAAQQAGVLEHLESLPDGLDTVLSAEHSSGADLSGGQWQRIALARALFAVHSGARFLILDEPTANLDVPGESEFYRLFLQMTGQTTPILISHRLSTVRHADHVVVLDGGRIAERGSHDQLMSDDTRYRRMFRLQASYFAASAAAEGEPK
jgi:ATP-binding cassette subfamily B protein